MVPAPRKTSEVTKKVLVVDDEPDVVLYLCTLLEEHGFAVCSAEDGTEGMRKVLEESPDLICLDIFMPEKSGILMYQEVKMNDRLKGIPVLFVTGFKTDDQPLFALKKLLYEHSIPMPEGFLEKPIDRESFIRAVRRILKGKGVPLDSA